MFQSGHEYVVEMAIFNVQRAITPKVCNPELRILRSAHRLILLNICGNFVRISQTVFELRSGPGLVTDRQTDYGRQWQNQCYSPSAGGGGGGET